MYQHDLVIFIWTKKFTFYKKNVTFQNGYFLILRIIYTSEVVVYHV